MSCIFQRETSLFVTRLASSCRVMHRRRARMVILTSASRRIALALRATNHHHRWRLHTCCPRAAGSGESWGLAKRYTLTHATLRTGGSRDAPGRPGRYYGRGVSPAPSSQQIEIAPHFPMLSVSSPRGVTAKDIPIRALHILPRIQRRSGNQGSPSVSVRIQATRQMKRRCASWTMGSCRVIRRNEFINQNTQSFRIRLMLAWLSLG